jgi:hypothetical protein
MYGSRLLDSDLNATMELFELFSALFFLPSYATGCENRPLANAHQLRAPSNVLDIGRKTIRLETRQMALALPCNVSNSRIFRCICLIPGPPCRPLCTLQPFVHLHPQLLASSFDWIFTFPLRTNLLQSACG